MVRTKIIYLFLVIISFLFIILYKNYFPVLLLALVLILPIVLFIMLIHVRRRITFYFEEGNTVVKKDEIISLNIIGKNKSFLPVGRCKLFISYTNRFSENKYKKYIDVTLDGKNQVNIACNIKSNHAGSVEIKLEKIKIYDYLCLFSLRKKIYSSKIITVLPNSYEVKEINDLSRNEIACDSNKFSTTKSGDDPSEIFNIREYRAGDKIQKIHWKLSLKEQDLMVKEFSLPIDNDDIILLDLNIKDESLNIVDGLLEIVASVSKLLNKLNREHFIYWYDVNKQNYIKERVTNEEDTVYILKYILLASKYSDEKVLLDNIIENEYSNILYVTSHITEEKINQ